MSHQRKPIADSRGATVSGDRTYRTHPAFSEDRKREELRRLRRPLERRLVWIQLAVFGVVLLLWPIPIVNPVKLLVVVFHELSHVCAAYLTGGVVFGIAIDPGGAGVTLGIGGNQIVIFSAGYVGSVLIGVMLYVLCAKWEPAEVWGVVSALVCASLAFGWLNDFTAVFGYGALLLLLLGLFCLDDDGKKFLLRLVATTSCLYPVIDVAGDLLTSSADGFRVRGEMVGSDVAVLARMTGVPQAAIAIPWVLIGIATVFLLIAWTARMEATAEARRSLFRCNYKQRLLNSLFDPDDASTIPEHTVR